MATITGLVTVNLRSILEVSSDPSAAAGTSALIGSLAMRSDVGQVWLKTGAADTAWNQLAFDVSSFTQGSVIFADASGNLTQDNAQFYWDDTNFRLGIGIGTAPSQSIDVTGTARLRGLTSAGVVLNSAAGVLSTGQVSLTTNVSGVLPIANGGTNASSLAQGALYSTGTAVASAPLTNGQLLVGSTGANPVAAALTAGTGISITNGAGTITVANTGVTSVALSAPSIFTVSGSPVTTTGTLSFSLNTQTANTIFAGPTTGSAAAPTFRAQVLADLPQLTNGQLYIGSTGTSVVASTLTAGTGISITNAAGSITIAATSGAGELVPSIGAGLTVNYTAGNVEANGVYVAITAGSVAVPASTTNGWVYANTSGVVTAGATLPATAGITPIGQFTSGASTVSSVSDRRTFINSQYVYSVALSDGSTTPIYSISNSPVTSTGTLTFTLATQAKNTIFAGPSSGANAQPTFRTQVLADLPQLTNGQLYVGSTGASVVAATLTAGTGISITNGAGTITVANTGVTSVALSDGSTTPIYSISGSPVTTTGTLTFTLASQAKNLVFAGPASGANAQPTFRALVAADLPTFTLGSVIFAGTAGVLSQDNSKFFWDDTNFRLGLNTGTAPVRTLDVGGSSIYRGALRYVDAGATNANWEMFQAQVSTTNNTVTTLATVATITNTVMLLQVNVLAVRTGGTSGTAGDSGTYIRTARVKNVGGTVTIASLQTDFTSEDQAAWNATLSVSGTNVLITVAGANNNNVDWVTTYWVETVV